MARRDRTGPGILAGTMLAGRAVYVEPREWGAVAVANFNAA